MATQKKKKNNRLIYILLALVVVLVVVAVIQSKNRQTGEKVFTAKVEKRDIQERVSASGKVFPVTEVNISSDVSGEIVELYVEEGDSVVPGQLLAKVDPEAIRSQVERSEALLNSAKAQLADALAQIDNFRAQREQIQAQLRNAREIHRRNEQLHKQGVISDADLEASLASVETLEANLKAAEANISAAEKRAEAARYSVKSSEATLKETKTSLRKTSIFAPMGGIVSRLNVEVGERVVGNQMMSGTEILRIADLNVMEVQVEVSENDIPNVHIGDPVEIEIDAYLKRKFLGRVSQIANSASNMTTATGAVALTTDQVTNFVVTIDIDRNSYKDLITPTNPYPFRPGMSASVEILTNTVEDALAVPIQAVATREREEKDKAKAQTVSLSETLDDDLMEVVFVVQADTVAMVPVTTGVQDDEYIQILSGLEEGQEVVAGPYAAVSRKLKAGDKVIVVSEEEFYKKED